MLARFRLNLLVLIWFFGMALSSMCGAQSHKLKAYLFIATETDSLTPHALFSSSLNRTDELRSLFYERLQSFPLELKTVTQAKQEDLAHALSDKSTAAIFWVGHSNVGSNETFGTQDAISDSEGINVAPLFQKIHSNLRWLAIIGCRAEGILQKYRELGYYRHNKFLRTYAYSTLVEETLGLSQATFASYLYLGAMFRSYPDYVCNRTTTPSRQMVLKRVLPPDQHGSAFQVFVNGHFIGIVPRGRPSQTQKQILWIDDSVAPNESPFHIQLQGFGDPVFGEITVETLEHRLTHQMVRKRDGSAMGQTQRVLIPIKPLVSIPAETRPSECQVDAF